MNFKNSTVFSWNRVKLNLNINGCFEPNLTTKVILDGVDKVFQILGHKCLSVLEVGCGSGGHFANVINLDLSDISEQSIETAKLNFKENKLFTSNMNVELKVGNGFKPWLGKKYDLIISDMSAISDEVAKFSDWFDFAPCDAGIDGIKNTLNILKNCDKYLNYGGILIFPILSLSNVKKLEKSLKDNPLEIKLLNKKKWPIPPAMVDVNRSQLSALKKKGLVAYEERFGQFIAETCCYSLTK